MTKFYIGGTGVEAKSIAIHPIKICISLRMYAPVWLLGITIKVVEFKIVP